MYFFGQLFFVPLTMIVVASGVITAGLWLMVGGWLWGRSQPTRVRLRDFFESHTDTLVALTDDQDIKARLREAANLCFYWTGSTDDGFYLRSYRLVVWPRWTADMDWLRSVAELYRDVVGDAASRELEGKLARAGFLAASTSHVALDTKNNDGFFVMRHTSSSDFIMVCFLRVGGNQAKASARFSAMHRVMTAWRLADVVMVEADEKPFAWRAHKGDMTMLGMIRCLYVYAPHSYGPACSLQGIIRQQLSQMKPFFASSLVDGRRPDQDRDDAIKRLILSLAAADKK